MNLHKDIRSQKETLVNELFLEELALNIYNKFLFTHPKFIKAYTIDEIDKQILLKQMNLSLQSLLENFEELLKLYFVRKLKETIPLIEGEILNEENRQEDIGTTVPPSSPALSSAVADDNKWKAQSVQEVGSIFKSETETAAGCPTDADPIKKTSHFERSDKVGIKISGKKHQALTILMMRFGLNPYEAIRLTSHWLQTHPTASWSTLTNLLFRRKVILKNGILHDVSSTEIKILINQMRGQNGIEIKNRWYNLKLYPKCFVGASVVEWFVKTQQVTREEAIQIGEILIDQQIIHHVHDDHNFKDEYLFYRFYIDETQSTPSSFTSELTKAKFLPRTIVI